MVAPKVVTFCIAFVACGETKCNHFGCYHTSRIHLRWAWRGHLYTFYSCLQLIKGSLLPCLSVAFETIILSCRIHWRYSITILELMHYNIKGEKLCSVMQCYVWWFNVTPVRNVALQLHLEITISYWLHYLSFFLLTSTLLLLQIILCVYLACVCNG